MTAASLAGRHDSAGLIQPWVDHPGRAALLTDFDGTLAPIVDRPDEARPLPGVAALLERLADQGVLVAVISGRPVQYLLDHLGAPAGVALTGLYGLEQAVDGRVAALPEAEGWRDAVDAVASEAERDAPDGILVERKGLAVGIHWRTAPHLARWGEEFVAAQAAARGLQAHDGKLSAELRPPVRADKGTVVESLVSGRDAVCFCGDDRGDLPAFAALERLRAGGTTTLAVAAASPEMPAELGAAADLVVDGPDGVVELLRRMAGE